MRVNDKKPAVFIGPLANLLDKFIAHKQSLGYKYHTGAEALTIFDAYSVEQDAPPDTLGKRLVEGWVKKRDGETANTQQTRITVIRQFAIFMRDLGFNAYVLPYRRGLQPKSYAPYVFTRVEIEAILTSADNQPVFGQYPQSHITTPALLRLLYGCGLRVSEALKLKISDVNLDEGIIKVIDSKFGRDRLIPLSESLTLYLRHYAELMRFGDSTEYFFPNRRGGMLTPSGAYSRFRALLWQSGISHGGRGKGPRLHDLRHTFSVHSLAGMVAQGMDIYCALPVLATYLGHEKLSTTGQYVRLTAEMYPEVISAVEKSCGMIFPEEVSGE